MNRKLGLTAAFIVTAATLCFAAGMLIGSEVFSYATSMILSWGYLLLACSLAVNAPADRKAFAYAGMAFAVVYAVFVDIVYFAQLTTVANQTASAGALQVLSYQSLGSLMFNYDLYGYGMMAASTFFIGTTLIAQNKPDKWLKALLMIHGVFAPACVLMPMLNLFKADAGNGGAIFGTIVLLFWCAYFTPVGILSILHFRRGRAG